MIESVKRIATMRATELPPVFYVRVGIVEYHMELEGMDTTHVYIRSTSTDETINIPRDEEVTILIPDTWENAALDIELSLLQKGLI